MLEEKIKNDYIQAMKNKDQLRATTLSFLRAQLKNVVIDKRVKSLDDADVIAVIKKQIKQRQESIKLFQDGGRQDLVDKETAEFNILKEYLPEELAESQIEALVKETVRETGASSLKDMGKVMKFVIGKLDGKADNKIVSDIVKKTLLTM